MTGGGNNHVAVFHGPFCGRPKCRAVPGETLIETWNAGRGSVDVEWAAAKGRVDNPGDHAGRCIRGGPDLRDDDEVAYAGRPA